MAGKSVPPKPRRRETDPAQSQKSKAADAVHLASSGSSRRTRRSQSLGGQARAGSSSHAPSIEGTLLQMFHSKPASGSNVASRQSSYGSCSSRPKAKADEEGGCSAVHSQLSVGEASSQADNCEELADLQSHCSPRRKLGEKRPRRMVKNSGQTSKTTRTTSIRKHGVRPGRKGNAVARESNAFIDQFLAPTSSQMQTFEEDEVKAVGPSMPGFKAGKSSSAAQSSAFKALMPASSASMHITDQIASASENVQDSITTSPFSRMDSFHAKGVPAQPEKSLEKYFESNPSTSAQQSISATSRSSARQRSSKLKLALQRLGSSIDKSLPRSTSVAGELRVDSIAPVAEGIQPSDALQSNSLCMADSSSLQTASASECAPSAKGDMGSFHGNASEAPAVRSSDKAQVAPDEDFMAHDKEQPGQDATFAHDSSVMSEEMLDDAFEQHLLQMETLHRSSQVGAQQHMSDLKPASVGISVQHQEDSQTPEPQVNLCGSLQQADTKTPLVASTYVASQKSQAADIENWGTDLLNTRRLTNVLRGCVLHVAVESNRKVITLKEEFGMRIKTVQLDGQWAQLNVQLGDGMNVILCHASSATPNPFGNVLLLPRFMDAWKETSSTVTVDSKQNLCILNPRVLIRCSMMSQAIDCPRRALLSDNIRMPGVCVWQAIAGSILHELFQAVVSGDSNFDVESLILSAHEMVQEYASDLASIPEGEQQVMSKVSEMIPRLQPFAELVCNQEQEMEYCIGVHQPQKLKHLQILDNEHNVFSTTFGIKGKIDSLVKVEAPIGTEARITALELKTGKNGMAGVGHRAQTLLYSLMVADRQGSSSVEPSLLVYLGEESPKFHGVSVELSHVAAVIMTRNKIAAAAENTKQLPGMCGIASLCQSCEVRPECMVIHKALENGNAESSGAESVFQLETSKCGDNAANYIRGWMHALGEEQRTILQAEQSELTGLTLTIVHQIEGSSRTEYGFLVAPVPTTNGKPDIHASTDPTKYLAAGDTAIFSNSLGHEAVCTAHITFVGHDGRLTMITEQPMFDPVSNERITDEYWLNTKGVQYSFSCRKHSSVSSLSVAKGGIMGIVTRQPGKWLDMIVNDKPPAFSEHPDAQLCSMLAKRKLPMTSSQIGAAKKIFQAKDFVLVLGMPGTGKTASIAQIICCMANAGKKVLVSAYTNSALDNLIEAILDQGQTVMRLGRASTCSEVVAAKCIPDGNLGANAYADALKSSNIVGVTCISAVSSTPLSIMHFDYVIVDEAAQVSEPYVLPLLGFAECAILVGDHYQLPPVHKSPNKRLAQSLFSRLLSSHPQSVVSLSEQFRMNDKICTMAQDLIYGSKLVCASKEVSNMRFQCIRKEALAELRHMIPDGSMGLPPLVEKLLSEESILFINTDECLGIHAETRVSGGVCNPGEAKLIGSLTKILRHSGLNQKQIGVGSVYRMQVMEIAKHVIMRGEDKCNSVQTMTVDKFQGGTKCAMFLSLVRSNETGAVGDLMRDWRRINVAITRARTKLVLVGSLNVCMRASVCQSLLQSVEKLGQVLTPSKESLEILHCLGEGASCKHSISQ